MGEQEVLRSNQITSPTEALDAILGSSSGDGGTADSQPTSPSETSAVPRDAKDAERKDGDANPGNVEVFNWSSKDPFFLFSDCECVAMGGGSAFALYLDKDLLHGISEPSSTFGSPCLSSSENFIIGDMELWAFDDPYEQAPW